MRKRKKGTWLFTFMWAFVLTLTPVSAGERPLYIGDVVELSIDANRHTQRSIEAAFSDMEIIDLVRQGDVFNLSIKVNEIGRQTVLLEDQEIVFEVTSTLEVIDRDQIFTGDLRPHEGGWVIYYGFLIYGLLGLMVIQGLEIIWRLFKKRRQEKQVTSKTITETLQELPLSAENYVVMLGHALKGYLGEVYKKQTQGMTNRELASWLKGLTLTEETQMKVINWLEMSGQYIYTDKVSDEASNRLLFEELLKILETVENEVEVSL